MTKETWNVELARPAPQLDAMAVDRFEYRLAHLMFDAVCIDRNFG
jgi:hypothetical protein